MTRIIWGDTGSKLFELGVDRGVLYVGGSAVPWNGLISFTEKSLGGELTPYYFDGLMYMAHTMPEDFAGSIEAYHAPDEFAACTGFATEGNGLSFGLQPRKAFDFSYRTLIGNDIQSTNYGYKIHLVYNAKVSANERKYLTLNNAPAASTFLWELAARPIVIPNRRPTSHLVIDSTKTDPALLEDIEEQLYGSTTVSPHMLTPAELVALFSA